MRYPVHRSRHLRWLLILVLLWQGVAAASMVPQMRVATTLATEATPSPCHMAEIAGETVAPSTPAMLDSCCDHPGCASAALCAACILPMAVGMPPLQPLVAGPVVQPTVAVVAASASHPFRPPIL